MAKWIYVVITVLSLLGSLANPQALIAAGGASMLMSVAVILLSLLSLWFLFRPDAKAWFAEGRGENS